MKTRSLSSVSIAVLVLMAVSAVAVAAPSRDGQPAADTAKMEACFRAHGNMMGKMSVRNIAACWYAHGYLMER